MHTNCKARVTIAKVTPDVSTASGDSTLRIFGTGMCRVCAVRIGKLYLPAFERINPHCITVVLPATSPGKHLLALVDDRGKEITAPFRTALGGPTLEDVQPRTDYYSDARLPTNHYRKRIFTLRGKGFAKVTHVWQDGVSLNFKIVDDHTILAEQRFQKGKCDASQSRQIAPRRSCQDRPTEPYCTNVSIHASEFTVTTQEEKAAEPFQVLHVQRLCGKQRACVLGVVAPSNPTQPCKVRCRK